MERLKTKKPLAKAAEIGGNVLRFTFSRLTGGGWSELPPLHDNTIVPLAPEQLLLDGFVEPIGQ